ncbi:MAG: hypothetical protein A4E32_01193 [Methanomassiliicoccales archaeon PtaU1.Bin124]|nr:MAG: hypothetical protein A4E32_01193 [Methanomassiliicoccales archaeon PtaU1.Bin124]
MTDQVPEKYCPNCGNPLAQHDVFCSRCGTNTNQQAAPPTAAPAPLPPPLPPPKKRKSAVGPIALIVVIGVVIGLLMLDIPQQLLEDGGFELPGLSGKTYTSGNGTKLYSWTYDNDNYTVRYNLTTSQYNYYHNNGIQRYMTVNDYDHGLGFITNDSTMRQLAYDLKTLADKAGLDSLGTANMVLSFVQKAMPYQYDNITYGEEEYWAFPIEMLWLGHGDCEDKSFMYCSLMEILGYDTCLLFFTGHVAAGIAMPDGSGTWRYPHDGVNYYYCETTGSGWAIGDKPEEYGDSHLVVVA